MRSVSDPLPAVPCAEGPDSETSDGEARPLGKTRTEETENLPRDPHPGRKRASGGYSQAGKSIPETSGGSPAGSWVPLEKPSETPFLPLFYREKKRVMTLTC